MSRHGYDDGGGDGEMWDLIRWRGAVASAARGKRGWALLRRLRAALDAMPDKRLVAGQLRDDDGGVCALGAVAQAEGLPVSDLHPGDVQAVAARFDVAPALVREITWINDDDDDCYWMTLRVGSKYEHDDGRVVVFFDGQTPKPDGRDGWYYRGAVYRRRTPDDDEREDRRRWQRVSAWVDRLLEGGRP